MKQRFVTAKLDSYLNLALCGIMLYIFPASVFACTENNFLLSRQTIELQLGKSTLITLDKNQADIHLEIIRAGKAIAYQHPSGRSGREFFLFDTDHSKEEIDVCLYANYLHTTAETTHKLSSQNLAQDMPQATMKALSSFTEAGRLWAHNGDDFKRLALEHYANIFQADSNFFRLSGLARLYAVKGNIQLFNYPKALEISAGFSPPSSGNKELDYLNYLDYSHKWQQGYALLRQRHFQAAIAKLSESLKMASGPYDRADIANLLGEAYLGIGNIAEGEKYIKQALLESGANHSLLAKVHNNLGYVSLTKAFQSASNEKTAQQHLQDSITEHLAARAFAINAGDNDELLMIENNLGTLYERTHELRKAQHHFQQSLTLTQKSGDLFGLRLLYQNLGDLNLNLGDHLKSLGYLNKAKEIAENSRDITAARIECLIGVNDRMLGRHQEAVTAHQRCINLAANQGSINIQLEALVELSEDYLQTYFQLEAAKNSAGSLNIRDASKLRESLNMAWQAIENAYELLTSQHMSELRPTFQAQQLLPVSTLCNHAFKETPAHQPNQYRSSNRNEFSQRLGAKIISRYALLQQLRHDEDQALRSLSRAHSFLAESRFGEQLEIVQTAMRIYRLQGKSQESQTCAQAAISLIESLHSHLHAERNGPAWSNKTHDTYIELVEILLNKADKQAGQSLKQQAIGEAFSVMERSRAISLRQHLSLPASDYQETEQSRLRHKLSQIADQHASLSEQEKARLLPIEYYHQQDLLELSKIWQVDVLPVPEPFSLEQIQDKLSKRALVLYFMISEQKTYLFTVTKERLDIQLLGSTQELTRLIDQLNANLRDPNLNPEKELQRLSAFLLPDHLDLAAYQELLIVPHRGLHTIPFSALSLSGQSSYRPLIHNHRISIIPSLSVYFREAEKNNRTYLADIAIFADPVFSASDSSATLVVPESLAREDGFRSWSATLNSLPFTGIEAKEISKLFRPDASLIFRGKKATLANLRQNAVRRSRILHIATHGYFQSIHSDNVGFVLSGYNQNNQAIPSFVTLSELFAQAFQNQLVVISGCDTAMGMQMAGEGMQGMTRGFIAQGAEHVLSTLWPVSDRGTSVFMERFYRELHSSGSIPMALQAAQQYMLSTREFRSPYYWAPYILTSANADSNMFFGTDRETTH